MTKIIYRIALAGILLIVVCFTGCKKKTDPVSTQPTPAPANGTVMLHLHTNIDTNEVDAYNQNYFMAGGRKVSLSIAQLYISSIQLVKSDGSTYDMSGVNILKLMQQEEYVVGSVPPGNYKSIRFNVGLAPATNTMVPAIADSTLNHPNMWFGNSAQPSGYVFLNLQGKIDTSAAANNTTAQMQPFVYRIGTNAHLKNVSMPDENYTVVSSQAHFIHIIIDYSKLFNGITLTLAGNLNVNSVSDNTSALSNQITNNIPLMFSYEE